MTSMILMNTNNYYIIKLLIPDMRQMLIQLKIVGFGYLGPNFQEINTTNTNMIMRNA